MPQTPETLLKTASIPLLNTLSASCASLQGRITFKNGRVYEGLFSNDHIAQFFEAEMDYSYSLDRRSDISQRSRQARGSSVSADREPGRLK